MLVVTGPTAVLWYGTRYGEADVRRVADGLHEVRELIGALDATDVDADRLTWLAVGVVALNGPQLAHVLASTVVVLHPRRRAVVERALELRRRHQDVVRDLVDDGSTSTELRFRLQRVNREVHLNSN